MLPSLAAILKIRKRKLIQVSADQNSTLITDSSFMSITKVSFFQINELLTTNEVSQSTDNSKVLPSLVKSLNTFSLRLESLREFNVLLFNRAQLTYLLFG